MHTTIIVFIDFVLVLYHAQVYLCAVKYYRTTDLKYRCTSISSLSIVLQNHILKEIAPQNGFYFHQFLSIPCRKNTLIGAEQQYSFHDKPKDFYLKCFIFLPQEHDTRKNNFFTEIKCKPRTTDAFLSNWVRVETYRTNI